MSSHLAISVVICAYTDERWDDLVEAVASIRRQTHRAHDIVVVVDHNVALFARARDEMPSITVVENAGPRGLSAARNSGIAAATGQVIAFIDDDAVADAEWLAHLAGWYADEAVIGVGGPVQPRWAAGRPTWFPEEFDWIVGCTFRGMAEAPQPVQRLIGCNMSFRHEVFTAIGGFRSGIGRVGSYPIAGEETELSIKIGQRWPGRQLIYDPAAWVGHRVPAARATFAYFRTRAFCEGVSKALVSAQVGSRDGLAAERAYTTRTLPLGILRGVAAAARGDPGGLGRASAIAVGLAITVVGYARGLIERRAAALAAASISSLQP